jgi:hypothetical protein
LRVGFHPDHRPVVYHPPNPTGRSTILIAQKMNLFTFPYAVMGSFLGPASILLLIVGVAISWRYGLSGTLAQQVVIFLVSACSYVLFSDADGVVAQRFSSGGFIGVIINFGIVPFNLAGFIGRYFTRKKPNQTVEAIKSCVATGGNVSN